MMMTKVSVFSFLAVLATAMAGPESDGVVALEQSHIRGQQGNMDTTTDRDLKKKPKCFTGTSAQVKTWCGTNNCCTDGASCSVSGVDILTVCANSCKGRTSCDSMGSGIVIKSGACIGGESCYILGFRATAAITVDEGACVGSYACYGIGSDTVTKITIGAGACVGDGACDSVGENLATRVSIDKKSCLGVNKCYRCDQTTSAALSIKKTCPAAFTPPPEPA